MMIKMVNFVTEKNNESMKEVISRNLKNLRTTVGYTQKEVADALEIKRNNYANYESGIREMPYELVMKASDFFGCEMASLYEDNENATADMLISAFRTNDLKAEDAIEVRLFKSIVKAYLKMDKLISE